MTDLKYLTPEELANLIQVPTGTLANWRAQGMGPAYMRAGHRVRYLLSDITAWSEVQRRDPTSKTETAA